MSEYNIRLVPSGSNRVKFGTLQDGCFFIHDSIPDDVCLKCSGCGAVTHDGAGAAVSFKGSQIFECANDTEVAHVEPSELAFHPVRYIFKGRR